MTSLRKFLARAVFDNGWKYNTALDEYWSDGTETRLPQVVGLCWVWCGEHIVGLFWKGFCVMGINWRITSEPALGVIVWNHSIGIWFPEN